MGLALVGRGRELDEWGRLAVEAAAGAGALVVVAGEAGIGKTTMLSCLAESAKDVGMAVLAGRAVMDEGAPAFWPWLRVLAQGAALGLSPALLDLDGGPAAQARFVAVERTARALVAAAAPAGLLVMLDDLQWGDDASLQLLRQVCAELPGSGLLVAVAARDTSRLGWVSGQPVALTVELAPLTVQDIDMYLRSFVESRVDRSWLAYVSRMTGGNPLLVRELVRALVAENRFAGPAVSVPMPESVRSVAGARLDLVSDECRWLLGGCSVLGEEFDVTLLAAVADRDADQVAGWLAEAVTAGVLVDGPDVPTVLRFAHALVRQARYDALARADRIWWHRRAADVLQGLPASVGQAGEMARHRIRAAEDTASCRQAVIACRAAAEVAVRSHDHSDAAHWYRRAVELVAGARLDGAEHAELLLRLAEAEYFDVQVSQALRHCVTGADLGAELGRADLVAQAALVVRGIGGERPNLVIAELCSRALALLGEQDVDLQARLLAQQALALAEATEEAPDSQTLRTAGELSHRAMQMATQSTDAAALVDALHAREKLVGGPDSGAERLELGARLRRLGSVAGRPEAALWSYLWRIDGNLHLGRIADADAEIAGLASLARRLGWPVARWHLLRAQAAQAMLGGRFAEAERLAAAGKELADRCEDPSMYGQYIAYTLDIRRKTGRFGMDEPDFNAAALVNPRPIVLAIAAEYRLAAGDADSARALFARLVLTLDTLPVNIRYTAIVGITGELAAAFNDVDTAARCYRLLLPYANMYLASSYGYRGAYARTLGVLAAAGGDHDRAVRHLQSAEAMEQRVGAPCERAMAQVAHARVLRARSGRGDSDRALSLAKQAAHTARRLGMAPTLTDATALVHELTGASPDAAGSLTARERQVALLLADGLPNRLIAEELGVSERTVETHVRNLLTKLGLTNRTQVAAWTLHAGLRS
jgi:DNA-binding CsgD family transcriptional regulator